MPNGLDALKKATTIVADTASFNDIKTYAPTDATTNPSLILKAVKDPQYAEILTGAIHTAKKQFRAESLKVGKSKRGILEIAMDCVVVAFGKEILQIVPGYVSTEVDARLSYDTEGSITRARRLIEMYETSGVSRDRILIKMASTWEGVEAARELEKEGIRCNMTLIFAFCQAKACAEANVTLISPFVGRIMDWYKKSMGVSGFTAEEDPGYKSVTRIYNYYKQCDYKTIVMGASFRNKEEILQLCGCDRLTIGPQFLKQLQDLSGTDVPVKLSADKAKDAAGAAGSDTKGEPLHRGSFALELCQVLCAAMPRRRMLNAWSLRVNIPMSDVT